MQAPAHGSRRRRRVTLAGSCHGADTGGLRVKAISADYAPQGAAGAGTLRAFGTLFILRYPLNSRAAFHHHDEIAFLMPTRWSLRVKKKAPIGLPDCLAYD